MFINYTTALGPSCLAHAIIAPLTFDISMVVKKQEKKEGKQKQKNEINLTYTQLIEILF